LIDFAGCSAVHMVGGVSSIVGAYFVGYRGEFVKDKQKHPPRFEKNEEGKWIVNELAPSNDSLAALGTFILWFGWYGFNTGSTGGIFAKSDIAGRIAVNTTLAPATASIVAIFVGKYLDKSPTFNLNHALNGILAGLVSITGPCAIATSYGAIIIGAVGAVVDLLGSQMLLKLRIDDAVDAFPVHGVCGVWGLLAGGLFAEQGNVLEVYTIRQHQDYGVFYGGDGRQLAVQIVAIIVVGLWTGALAVLMWGAFRFIDDRRKTPLFIFKDVESFETLTFGVTKAHGFSAAFIAPNIGIDTIEMSHLDVGAANGVESESDLTSDSDVEKQRTESSKKEKIASSKKSGSESE